MNVCDPNDIADVNRLQDQVILDHSPWGKDPTTAIRDGQAALQPCQDMRFTAAWTAAGASAEVRILSTRPSAGCDLRLTDRVGIAEPG